MHESNEQLFMDSVGTIELTQEEKVTVDWLCGWSPDTIKNLVSIIEKVKAGKWYEEIWILAFICGFN